MIEKCTRCDAVFFEEELHICYHTFHIDAKMAVNVK